MQLLDERHSWGNHLGTSTRHCRMIFHHVTLHIQRLCDVLSNRSAEIRVEPKPRSLFFFFSYLIQLYLQVSDCIIMLENEQVGVLGMVIKTSEIKSMFIKRRKTHSLLTQPPRLLFTDFSLFPLGKRCLENKHKYFFP